MKKTILSIAFALIATIGVETFAQQPQNNHERDRKEQCQPKPGSKKEWKDGHKHQHGRSVDMFHGLNLSPEQREKVTKLDNERREKKDKLDKKTRNEREKAQADYDKKLKKILTAEQYNQYLKNKERQEADGKKVRQKFEKHDKKVNKVHGKQSMHHKGDSLLQQQRHKKQAM